MASKQKRLAFAGGFARSYNAQGASQYRPQPLIRQPQPRGAQHPFVGRGRGFINPGHYQQPYQGPSAPTHYQPPPMVTAIKVPDISKMDTSQKKLALGESLYPIVNSLSNEKVAGKITGMLLEMSNEEVLQLLKNPAELRIKVSEAVTVLKSAWANNSEQLKNLGNL